MYNEINEKMEQAQQGIARLQKIDSMIRQLEAEQEQLECREKELKAVLEKENYDVEKIENRSIASIFHSILGNLDEHIEKERKEALAAKLKYDQVIKDLEDIGRKLSQLSSERLDYADCQREYEQLYVRKKEALMQEKGVAAQKILELEDKINSAKINLKEIKEAAAAGNNVLDSLNNALTSLDKAAGWGTWDLLGGGFISDLAKHSNIDGAKEEIENTQRLLRQFKTELADISIDSGIAIETGGFAKFADFFFDGLIADWFMQSRINESRESVSRVKGQVLSVLEKLGRMEARENANIKSFEAEAGALVVNS